MWRCRRAQGRRCSNDGHIPIVEEGLEAIVNERRAAGLLDFVLGAEAAAEGADIVFLCVPTPQGDDGSADLSYIEAAAAQIAPVLHPGAVVVNKSTVPVGSTLRGRAGAATSDVFVVSNPEFLREGTAVARLPASRPGRDRQRRPGRRGAVAELYATIDTPILITDPASAETIKYAANGFLAMKISFVNAVAAMCEAVGADVATSSTDRFRSAHRQRVPATRSRAGAAVASRRTRARWSRSPRTTATTSR